MNELVREIEEDIRREQLDKLWAHFGRLMVGVSAAVLIATAGFVFWQDRKEAQEQAQTVRLLEGINLLNHEDYKGALAAFNTLAGDEHSSYYGVAMLRKAQAQNASGDKEGAAKTYAGLAKHDAVFGPLAGMLAAQNKDYAGTPSRSSPFYLTQSEWKNWELLRQGKKDEAVAGFIALRDSAEIPFTMRQRIKETLQYIAPEKAVADKGNGHE